MLSSGRASIHEKTRTAAARYRSGGTPRHVAMLRRVDRCVS